MANESSSQDLFKILQMQLPDDPAEKTRLLQAIMMELQRSIPNAADNIQVSTPSLGVRVSPQVQTNHVYDAVEEKPASASNSTPMDDQIRPSSDESGTQRKRRKTYLSNSKLIKKTITYEEAKEQISEPKFPIGAQLRTALDTTTGTIVFAIDRFVVLKKDDMFVAKDVEAAQLMDVDEPVQVSEKDKDTGAWVMLEFLLDGKHDNQKERVRNTKTNKFEVLLVIRQLADNLRRNTFASSIATSRRLDEIEQDICEQKKELPTIAKEIRGDQQLQPIFDFVRQQIIKVGTDHPVSNRSTRRDDDEESSTDDEAASMSAANPLETLECNKPGSVVLNDLPPEIAETFWDLHHLNLLHLCRFDVIRVLTRVYKHLVNPEGTREVPRMIGGGRTQIGKTILKLAVAMLAHKLEFCSVLVSPGQANCIELSGKLRKCLKDSYDVRELPFPFAVQGDVNKNNVTMRGKDIDAYLKDTFFRKGIKGSGGIAVTNFLHSQLGRLRKSYESLQKSDSESDKETLVRGMVVLLDEADDLYKNTSLLNLQEIALRQIIEEHASLLVEVTATPAPLFANLVKMKYSFLTYDDIIILETDPQYVSPDDFEIMVDPSEGKSLFLVEKELCVGNSFLNDKVYALYDDAVEQRKRSLLIDMTTSRVSAPGGMQQRGCEILKHYSEKHIPLVILLVTGSGMQYRFCCLERYEEPDIWIALPRYDVDKKSGKKVRLQLEDGINHIERELRHKGPIFVMGYTMIFRGISIRNNTRVPTHMIINISKANSLERVVQAFGRGTGIFREQLELNGFVNKEGRGIVKVLVFEQDYFEVREYQKFVKSVQSAMNEPNTTIDQAVDRALDSQNLIANESERPIGQKKMLFREFLIKNYPRHLPIPHSYDFSDESIIHPKELTRLCKKYAVDPGNNSLLALREARETRNNLRKERIKAVPQVENGEEEELDDDGDVDGDSSDEDDSLLDSLGLKRHPIVGDGNCFYSALAIAYNGQKLLRNGEKDIIQEFRNLVADRLAQLEEEQKSLLLTVRSTKDFKELLNSIRHNREWADEHEIVALSEALGRKIMVVQPLQDTLSIRDVNEACDDSDPLYVFYNGADHYDALISSAEDSFTKMLASNSQGEDSGTCV